MAFSKPVLAAILLFLLLDKYAESVETPSSSSNEEDTASIPMIASGKRQHNIMRFGKRPASGHNLLRFGKRDDSRPPQHSFLYFGKRMEDQTYLPDLLQYLQKSNDKSYKRGHTIMRFGKRSPSGSNFMTFGKDEGEDDYDAYYPDDGDIDELKRAGHNMMYFGKRGGHSMMYFGKRAGGHNMLSFGKRDDDKRAHSMIHFGKREDEDDDDDMPYEEKRAHSMIHFGKRESDDYDYPDMDVKRAAHSMIHFGKRDFDPELLPYWNPNTYEKKQHNLLRFGKKMDSLRKGSHAMIHFGKRDDDKRAHSMIHFGKRSVDQNNDSASNNQSGNGSSQQGPRVKRDLDESVRSAEPVVVYGSHEDEDLSTDEDLENAIKASQAYHANEIMDHLSYPDEEQALFSFYPDYRPVHKKEASKNVFLRFG